MVKSIILIASVAGLLTSSALDAIANRRHLTAADKAFVTRATMGNNYEIQAAEIAKGAATNDADRKFADMMIAEHNKLAADLKAAVLKNDPAFALPEGVSKNQQAMLNALKNAGANFATVYKRQMLAAHAEVRATFRQYAAPKASNSDIKAVVTGAMPAVDKHLDMAKALPAK